MKKLLLLLTVVICAYGLPGAIIDEEPEYDVIDGLKPEEITKIAEETFPEEDKNKDQFSVPQGLRVAEIEETDEEYQEEENKVSYDGSQLWRVVADDKKKLKLVAKLRDSKDLSMWGGNVTAVDVLVKDKSTEKVKESFLKNSIRYEVVIENVQKAIDEENPKLEDEEEFANRQGHRMTWQSYHRLSDIHGYLDYLAQTYPDIVSTQVIGSSVQGKALKVVKISNGKKGNPAVWVDGGMHAREWISPATVTYIINQLTLNYDNEDDTLKNVDWYFLPVANPDGYEYSHTIDRLWRKNRARSGTCAGTDLNRNFGYKWGGKGNGRNPCQEIYGGTGPFSEPETAAIRTFITSTPAKWKGYVSFHSYGQYILFPWGYDRVVTSDYQDLANVAQKAAKAISSVSGTYYTTGPAGSTLYPASGGSDDWAKGSAGFKYAYTIELRDSGRHGFVLPAQYINPTAKEAWAALKVIATAAATK